MYRALANIISYVLHPLLLTTLLVGVLYLFAPTVVQPIGPDSVGPILIMVFILTYVIPLFSVVMLKVTSSISSIKLEGQKERIMPFFFITIYYGLTTYMFSTKFVLSDTLIVMFGAITSIILAVTLITPLLKVSAHSAGIWGVVGILLAIHFKFPDSQLYWPLLIALVLAGVVNSCRLLLNAHDLREVGIGSALGFIISFGSILIMT